MNYDLLAIKRFIIDKVNLADFCFILEHKIRNQYSYRLLAGDGVTEKILNLLNMAKVCEEVGEIIFLLIKEYWINDVRGNSRIIFDSGLFNELVKYYNELTTAGDTTKAALVLDLVQQLKPGYETSSPESAGSTKESRKSDPPLIFISYSRKDEKEKKEVVTQLQVLERADILATWSDDKIDPGSLWEEKIFENIENAGIAIFLVTANFLTSDYILEKEVPRFLERHKKGLIIYPIIMKECAFKKVDWFAQLSVRPFSGLAVWRDNGIHVNKELAEIAEEIADIIEKKFH